MKKILIIVCILSIAIVASAQEDEYTNCCGWFHFLYKKPKRIFCLLPEKKEKALRFYNEIKKDENDYIDAMESYPFIMFFAGAAQAYGNDQTLFDSLSQRAKLQYMRYFQRHSYDKNTEIEYEFLGRNRQNECANELIFAYTGEDWDTITNTSEDDGQGEDDTIDGNSATDGGGQGSGGKVDSDSGSQGDSGSSDQDGTGSSQGSDDGAIDSGSGDGQSGGQEDGDTNSAQTLFTLHYSIDKYDIDNITQYSKDQLNKAFSEAKACLACKIEIIGYADKAGSDDYNEKLSKRRSDAVMLYLKANGIEIWRINTRYVGRIGTGSDNARKVEIYVIEPLKKTNP